MIWAASCSGNREIGGRIIIARVRRIGDISLNQAFLIATALILACTLALGLSLLGYYYRTLRDSEQSLKRISAFGDVLFAASRISAERGPTNAALGLERSENNPALRRLSAFRQASDQAISRIASGPTLGAAVDGLRDRLAKARREVDGLLAQPLAERSRDGIEQAIFGMFAAYDATRPVIDTAMTDLLASDPALIGEALTARMAGELRDYAGRLGSYVVIAIAHGEPMSDVNRAAFEQTRGRVLQIWDAVGERLATHQSPAVRGAQAAAAREFFGAGLKLIDETDRRLRVPGGSATPESFTNAIVPSFTPIERLRDAFVDAALARLSIARTEARTALVFASAVTALILIIVLLLLLASRSFLFEPLMLARERVIDFAEGRLTQPIEPRGQKPEMRHLFQALSTLRSRLVDREMLDAERSRLTAELKVQADTDGLTGVLNRGALERAVVQLAEAQEAPSPIGLILLDLDHFKAVNDQYGHAAGDAALRLSASRLRGLLRDEDIVARFGGEEFAVVVPNAGEARLAEIAERLRRAIEGKPFPLDDGRAITLTASLGVARISTAEDVWPELLKAADGALYEAKRQGRNRVVTSQAAG